MPEDPEERSTFTPRRSPDVIGSRPPRIDRARALRQAYAVIAVLVVCVVVALVVLAGGEDDGPGFTGPSANDPVSVLCRSSDDRQSSACATGFFACRDQRARTVTDAGLAPGARPRLVAAGYVERNWSGWEAPVRAAARRGCLEGLRE